jgi:hypothetical protein
MVRSLTVTEKRCATCSRSSLQRQRTTLLIFGSGPAMTSSRSSFIWVSVSFGSGPGALRDTRPSAVHPVAQGLAIHPGLPSRF